MGGGTPKTLMPIKGDKPLMHFILRVIREAGIDDLVVITGHRANEIQEYVDGSWTGDVQYVWNPRYASWGNFHSLRLALEQSPGRSLLVMNSDIVVKPDVIRKIVARNGDLVLAVMKSRRLDGEDMRVRLAQGDIIVAIGKDLKPTLSHGEFTGVTLIRPAAARAYQDIATDLEWLSKSDHYYEDLFGMMIGPTILRASLVEPGEYAEVDTPEDQRAAGEVIDRHFPREVPQAAGVG